MAQWRSEEMQKKYDDYRAAGGLEHGCALCKEASIAEFQYWRIINNNFPYDRVAIVHHTLVPKRHIDGDDITPEEFAELNMLKKGYINEHYSFILEATNNTKSIPAHYHLHLVVPKEAA